MKNIYLLIILMGRTSVTSQKTENIIIDFYPQGNYKLFNKVSEKLNPSKESTKYFLNTPEGNNCPGNCRTITISWKKVDSKENPKIEIISGKYKKMHVFREVDSSKIAAEIEQIIFGH